MCCIVPPDAMLPYGNAPSVVVSRLAAVLFLVGAGAQLKGLSRQQREILLAIEQHGALMPQVEAELARPPATDVRMAALGDL